MNRPPSHHLPFVLAQLSATPWGPRSSSAPRAARLPLCLLWTDGVISVWLIRFSLHCQYCFSLHVISATVWCARGECDETHSVDLLCTGAYWFEILLRANRSNLDWNWFYKENNTDGKLFLALESGTFLSLNKQCILVKILTTQNAERVFGFRQISSVINIEFAIMYAGIILRDEDANLLEISINLHVWKTSKGIGEYRVLITTMCLFPCILRTNIAQWKNGKCVDAKLSTAHDRRRVDIVSSRISLQLRLGNCPQKQSLHDEVSLI